MSSRAKNQREDGLVRTLNGRFVARNCDIVRPEERDGPLKKHSGTLSEWIHVCTTRGQTHAILYIGCKVGIWVLEVRRRVVV